MSLHIICIWHSFQWQISSSGICHPRDVTNIWPDSRSDKGQMNVICMFYHGTAIQCITFQYFTISWQNSGILNRGIYENGISSLTHFDDHSVETPFWVPDGLILTWSHNGDFSSDCEKSRFQKNQYNLKHSKLLNIICYIYITSVPYILCIIFLMYHICNVS